MPLDSVPGVGAESGLELLESSLDDALENGPPPLGETGGDLCELPTPGDLVHTAIDDVEAWRSGRDQCEPIDTLAYVEEVCERLGLGTEAVKRIFDACEEPFFYDIETRAIRNMDEGSGP